MTGPRNRKAFAHSLRQREHVRQAWDQLRDELPYDRISATDVLRRLPFSIAVRTVRWHLARIRDAHTRAQYPAVADRLPS